MPLDEQDTVYLERAMSLAERARGCTSPNPLVGAVIVAGGRVLGEGYHAGPWRDHAEVAAIKDALRSRAGGVGNTDVSAEGLPAGEVCAGATMYVTLEPCCNYGRTPPCTSVLIAGGLSRVVVGAIDPSPNVNGRGLDQLRAAGIQVDMAEGELAQRIKRQNNGLRKAVTTGRPFVTYKYAMTLDGRVATDAGDSRWISSSESRVLVHRLRAWSDAVMVGAGTLRADDPRLTAREAACDRQPLRVVLDGGLTLHRDLALVKTADQGPVLAVCGTEVPEARRTEVESWGVETVAVRRGEDTGLEPAEVADMLGARGVQTVLLEGGPRLAGAWWAAGLIDMIMAFVCPQIVLGLENRAPLLGSGSVSMGGATRLRELEVQSIGPDLLVSGYVEEPF
ncbi:MAG: bifunctional diaminohydroxyphosphoribosylaminopyrimidine deaminase/5-amino-6-(5-phosphoribosylamino)uracil reductase RibD [bacterium]